MLLRTASRKRDSEETRKKNEELMVCFPDHPARGGRTPLHLATIEGSVPICRLLLDAGATHTATDQYGVTPLHTACGNGHFRLVEMLLKHAEGHEAPGLYPTLVWKRMYINRPNAHNADTPLHVACRSGHPWAAKLLVDYIKGKIGFPSKASAETMSAFINAKNKDGCVVRPRRCAAASRIVDVRLSISLAHARRRPVVSSRRSRSGARLWISRCSAGCRTPS
jgi:ankyrin repeat protein